MEKIVNLWNYSIDVINKDLEDGWTVKMIVPYTQHVACSSLTMDKEGSYGAFVILEKLKDCETVNETFIKKVIALLQTPLEIPCKNRKYTFDEVTDIILEYHSKLFNKLGVIINEAENN